MTEANDDRTATNVHRVEITDDGHTVAAAEVTTSADPHGTAQVVLHAESGHLPAGTRTHLVDAVLDLADVQHNDHLQVSAPIGDSESITRIRQRSTDMRSHAAGCTAIIDAELTASCDCAPPVPS
jgi:hypothetical protein